MAQAEAQRITAEARVEAQRITAEARVEAQRITSVAQAAGRGDSEERNQHAHVNGRTLVAIFFQSELAAATDGFADSHRIGGGGFGSVYHATRLRGMGIGDLAIKKLDMASMQGQREFLQEVQVLGACRHETLIPLLGFAADTGSIGASANADASAAVGVCLVTPLMKGGSLEDRLILDDSARRRLMKLPGAPVRGFEPLSWQQRLIVAEDLVMGVLFLHTPNAALHKPMILHRDIKPSNILLDMDCHARLADMGLARAQRLTAPHLTTMTSIAGTNGYLDEYYVTTGRFDEAADGYAVGVTMLALLKGSGAIDPDQGHIIGQFEDLDDVSVVADTRVQWPREVVNGVHKVGMGLVKRNRAMRISLTAALEQLQQLVNTHISPVSELQDLVERECLMCLSAPRHVRFGW